MIKFINLQVVEDFANKAIKEKKETYYKENEKDIQEDVNSKKLYLKELNEEVNIYYNMINTAFGYFSQCSHRNSDVEDIKNLLSFFVVNQETYEDFCLNFESAREDMLADLEKGQELVKGFCSKIIIKLKNNGILTKEEINNTVSYVSEGEPMCLTLRAKSENKEYITCWHSHENFKFLPSEIEDGPHGINFAIREAIIESMLSLIESKINFN